MRELIGFPTTIVGTLEADGVEWRGSLRLGDALLARAGRPYPGGVTPGFGVPIGPGLAVAFCNLLSIDFGGDRLAIFGVFCYDYLIQVACRARREKGLETGHKSIF